MNSKQIFAFIVFLLVLIALAVLITQFGGEADQEAEVPIEAEFPGKVVYTTNVDETDVELLRNDCRERGGVFNECGSICAPDAEVCADVCAYACDDIPVESGTTTADVPDTWETYDDQELGFRIMHPQSMDVGSEPGGRVQISMWGPTQVADTEFFDGISMTIGRISLESDMSLQALVEEKMNEQSVNPIQEESESIEVGGREALTFDATGEIDIQSTYVYVQGGGSAFYEIVYVAPDPTGQGFQETVEMMLSTFEVI